MVIGATADRVVIDDLAVGVQSASSGTGVSTLLINASLLRVTLSADNAFRSALRGSSDVSGYA